MNPYLPLPLTACVICSVMAAAILIRDARQRSHQVGALLVSGAAVWAFFEVLWAATPDRDTALRLVRLSSMGFVALGPLALHLFLSLAARPRPRARRCLPVLYGISVAFFALDVTTDWMHPAVHPAPWGWAYELGPIYLVYYAFTVGCILTGSAVYFVDLRHSLSPAERSQARWLLAGIAVPLVVASLTDGLLPAAGVQTVRLGTLSFGVLGATMAWSSYRYGFSLLAPGAFAAEILSTIPDGVALLRLDGSVRTTNDGFARLVGCQAARLEGSHLRARFSGAWLDPARPERDHECELRTEAGTWLPVAVTTSTLCDKLGAAIGLVVVVRDLREVAALRRRLVTSGRLAAVGELAAGIAHEINNPLAFVRSNLGVLREALTSVSGKLPSAAAAERAALEEGQELVEESLDGVDRVAAIVRDVKGFSRAEAGERQRVDLDGLLDRVLRVAAPQCGPGVRVSHPPSGGLAVLGAEQELHQVFLNLVVNAAQAVGEEGRIRVTAAQDGSGVTVTVEDDGSGIEPDVMDRIFDPFFTTKAVGEGTGLGLAISYQIVRHHEGEITVSSEPGSGARFHVWLPAA